MDADVTITLPGLDRNTSESILQIPLLVPRKAIRYLSYVCLVLLGHDLCPPCPLRTLPGLLSRLLLALPAAVDVALGLVNRTLE